MRHVLLTTLLLIGVPAVLQAEDRGPFAQSCLDDPPAPTDRFLVNLCESFAQEARVKTEARPCDAVCRYPADKLREDIEAREAGAARLAQWSRSRRSARNPSIEELDREIAMMETYMRPQMLSPYLMMPAFPRSFSCDTMYFGSSGSSTYCY